MKLNNDITIECWLNHWYDTYAKRTIKQSTAISYRGYITNHINPQIGLYKLSELNADVLQCFFNYEMESGSKKDGGGLSPKTLHNIKLMLHKALKKAMELELINKNYAEFVELPHVKKPQIHILSFSEQQKLLSELRHSEESLYFGVYLALSTGMRLGEVLGLRWSDVDLDNNVLHIKRTVNRLNTLDGSDGSTKTELVVGVPKSDTSIRDIPFNNILRNEFIKYREKMMKRLSILNIKSDDYVLMLRRGKPVEPKTMQDVWHRIEHSAGIQNQVTFHGLRHTFATRAIEIGVDVKTLSVLLGHSDVAVTLSRYTHISEQQKRNAMNIILAEA